MRDEFLGIICQFCRLNRGNDQESDKNAQRKPKKIDSMWTHDKFDPEAQMPRNARRGAGSARKNFNEGGAGFHGNKNDARR